MGAGVVGVGDPQQGDRDALHVRERHPGALEARRHRRRGEDDALRGRRDHARRMHGGDRALARAEESPVAHPICPADGREHGAHVLALALGFAKRVPEVHPLVARGVDYRGEEALLEKMAARADQEVAAQPAADFSVPDPRVDGAGCAAKKGEPIAELRRGGPLGEGRGDGAPGKLGDDHLAREGGVGVGLLRESQRGRNRGRERKHATHPVQASFPGCARGRSGGASGYALTRPRFCMGSPAWCSRRRATARDRARGSRAPRPPVPAAARSRRRRIPRPARTGCTPGGRDGCRG